MTPETTQIVIAGIAAIPSLCVSTAALVSVLRNANKVQEIHLALNSRLDEFKTLIAASSFAKGVKSETDKWPNSQR
jgi:hypothetical protein